MAPVPPDPIRVWVVEDSTDLRETLIDLLNHADGLTCEGAFGSVEEVIEVLGTPPGPASAWTRPSVILLDINLPGTSGLDGLITIKSGLPDTNVVMLSVREEPETIFEALRRGASGYLLKQATVDEIIGAVRQAHVGGLLMPSSVAHKVFTFFREEPPQDYGLTEREKEVLGEMVEGYTQKEVAERLFVSAHTVNTHVKHIYAKLHVRSGIEAVVKALRERLL
ncbi:MAG: response regulator transcription factor [Bacteroidota bacterium]